MSTPIDGIVDAHFQGDDEAYLVDALARLGPGFVGVTQLPQDVTDARACWSCTRRAG